MGIQTHVCLYMYLYMCLWIGADVCTKSRGPSTDLWALLVANHLN